MSFIGQTNSESFLAPTSIYTLSTQKKNIKQINSETPLKIVEQAKGF
jgi:hypothetical protein